MKKQEEYKEHIEEGWTFASDIANKLADTELRNELAISIFDKTCSPLHYFLEDNESKEKVSQPPSEKQLSYAITLGISNPEKYSRNELSKKIDEALKEKKNYRIQE